ncbi:MAG: hypothetical protein V4640_03315 [Verrucomicrobiota bacterium]
MLGAYTGVTLAKVAAISFTAARRVRAVVNSNLRPTRMKRFV